MHDVQWHYPTTLKAALAIYRKHRGEALPVAGATTLALRTRLNASHLIDLGRCGLGTIRASKATLTIGAMTRVADLLPAVLPGAQGAFVAAVAGGIATTPLRNMITVGGNLAQTMAWSDLPVVLAALDAQAVLQGARPRRLPVLELCARPAQATLKPGELIVAVEIPRAAGSHGWAYQQLKRTATDYSLVNVAAWLSVRRGVVSAARLVAGAVRARPVLLEQAGAALIGQPLAAGALPAAALAAAAAAAQAGLSVAADFRASRDYRQQMLGVLTRRALEAAAGRCAP